LRECGQVGGLKDLGGGGVWGGGGGERLWGKVERGKGMDIAKSKGLRRKKVRKT